MCLGLADLGAQRARSLQFESRREKVKAVNNRSHQRL